LLGGEEGRRLVTDADGWMTAQGIGSPSRMTAVLAPGFPGG
jgi:eukaryotic-like serine/threonine-protein kinase